MHGKKFNAVGDPDGNDSSSDSESDDDEEEKLVQNEKDSFEVMMELASRREGMKQKIEMMEEELSRRKRNMEEEEYQKRMEEMLERRPKEPELRFKD